ncbi:MAG: SDR family oxidoreductase [Saprospiraceae bacterium]|nr:SDR family oxidoreductase [Saprospiraceae bacterium]HMW37794.1 SDR family oxidoreductase [Saprospiraceae bacterium]HMX87480.1 SDR family oxidoreductase [Saprospiraceae bacterium]HMZ39642.1 SDR family oxidoreductase [Saprospiraceae bacterium]HNA63575.1 SDR family oxidoreductase [Saprospiraceae bacterium]
MLTIDLKGRRVLVCGASKGIGLSVSRMLAQCGAEVCLLARQEGLLQKNILTMPSDSGQRHQWIAADMNDHTGMLAGVRSKLEQGPFDILVNNTGGPAGGKLWDATSDQLLMAFNQHLIAAHELMKILIPGMKSSSYGRIINIISTSVKQPLENLGVSNTIRAAMASWAKTLANELGESGITVNNVLPGATDTDRLKEIIARESLLHKRSEEESIRLMQSQIPLKRFALPEEIASAVAFLASPLAGYITGINLPVDGGRTKSL